MTRNHLDPNDAAKLRNGFAELTQRLRIPESVKLGIYEGLCEAMTNTKDHAYQFPEELRLPYMGGRWWMTGSTAVDGTEIEVVFFDQGISIPVHLPKTSSEFVKKHIRSQAFNDAKMIEAAVKERRSATQESNRGKGLGQIQELINRAPTGQLRILSRSGE